mgnify:CR=1 FL=1
MNNIDNNITLQLPTLEKQMKENNQTILTPLVSLDTPGKSTVEVVILADPVCFHFQMMNKMLISPIN